MIDQQFEQDVFMNNDPDSMTFLSLLDVVRKLYFIHLVLGKTWNYVNLK